MRWMEAAFLLLGLYAGEGNKTTIPNLSRSRLGNFEVPLPPLSEQKAIAEVLRTVQRAKEATEKVIAATRQLKASLMKHLFTYGPVPFDQADKVPSKETAYGPMPNHWTEVELKDAVSSIDYGLSAPIPKTPPKDGVKIVSTADITKGGQILYGQIRTVEAPPKTVGRLALRSGDVLFNWRNSPELVGKTGLFERTDELHIFASFILRIRTDERSTHNVFIKHLLNYLREEGVFLQLARRAVNQANYNRNEIGVLRIPLPPYREQVDIAELIAGVDAKLASEEKSLITLKSLFESSLRELMTGRIRAQSFGESR